MTTDNQRHTLLVVDDSEMNRAILADILDKYDITEAKNGSEAVDILRERGSDISLVLLDYVMPVMNGFDVLEAMNLEKMTDDIPVIMISTENSPSYVRQAYELGVIDFITRPFDALMVQHRVANTIQLYAKQKKLARMVEEQIIRRERQSSTMVHILSNIVEFRNGESGMHVLHIEALVKIFLQKFLEKVRPHCFLEEDIDCICMASCLHDIGKIAISSEILNKPGKLTKEEYEIMKTHTTIGADMLSRLSAHKDDQLIKVSTDICRWHHERYDGSGYPDGLKGDEIPVSAQVVALADVYDALTSKRVYKPAIPHEKAVQMILNGECGAFNPALLECLAELAPDLESLLENTTKEIEYSRENRNVVNKVMRRREINGTDKAVALLEKQRIRSDFIDELTEEIEFEYSVDPPVVRLSSWAAEYTGLGEMFSLSDGEGKLVSRMAPDDYFKLVNKVRNSTPSNPVISQECRINLGGKTIWGKIVARTLWSEDDPTHYTGLIGKMINIDAMKTLIDDLEYRATHDSLTGLMNRAAAVEHIKSRLEAKDVKRALIMLDVDFFKTANDSFGHAFGDKILKLVAEKLKGSVRGERDIVARVGGDEFLIFIENYGNKLYAIVRRIFSALNDRVGEFTISVSMGIAEYGDNGRDTYEQLFLAADRALYTAKQAGRGQYMFYNSSMEHTLSNISPIDEK